MQSLKKIFTNPVAIAIVAAHWLVFIFAMFYEKPQHIFSNAFSAHAPEPVLFNWLLRLNTPSVLIMQSVIYPVLSLFERNLLTKSFDILFFVIFSSLQWLCLGYLIGRVVEIYQQKEVKLSLK